MSNDTNMDNRVLAEFLDIEQWTDVDDVYHTKENEYPEFDKYRNALHRVWEKFRDLKFDTESFPGYLASHKHFTHTSLIVQAMAYGTLTDLYNALVQAVKWYNEVTKQKQ